jgi:hypothetical protein
VVELADMTVRFELGPVEVEASVAVTPQAGGDAEIGLGDPRTRQLRRHLMNLPPAGRFPGSGTLIEETRLKGGSTGR